MIFRSTESVIQAEVKSSNNNLIFDSGSQNMFCTVKYARASLALVLNPNQLLQAIEDIPDMRKISQWTKFQEPTIVKTHTKTKQNQT